MPHYIHNVATNKRLGLSRRLPPRSLRDQTLGLRLNSDILNMAVAMAGGRDLDVASLDIALELIKPGVNLASPPSGNARVKHVIHLLQSFAFGLGRGEEHVNEGKGVEGAKNHIHLPVDAPQKWRHGESERAVPSPVRCGGERDGFCAHFGGKDLRRVGPRGGTPGCSECGNEEVRTGNNSLGNCTVILGNNP
jgi:hypothetical protein